MMHFIREIYRIEIIGITPERFLNVVNRRQLPLFNVHCVGNRMFGFIAAADFPSLSDAAQKAGVRLEITDRHGLPFLARHYRKRLGFIVGLGLFCLVLWYLSLFVWFVDTVNVPEAYAVSVSDALNDLGVRTGVFISSVDGPLLEVELEERLPQFDLIKVSCMGCNAQVYFSPTHPIKDAVSDHEPCDLTASQGGVIVSVVANEGLPLVEQGDVVYPGDTLISGVFSNEGGKNTMVHSSGEVTALVEETFSESVSYKQTATEPTGRAVNIHRVMAFGMEIPLFGSPPKGNYSRISHETPVTVGEFSLPILLRSEQWQELCYIEKTFTQEECIAQAETLIDKKLQKSHYKEIVSSDTVVSEWGGGIRVTRTVTLLKEISQERKLLFDPAPPPAKNADEP